MMSSTMAISILRTGLKIIPLALIVVAFSVSAYWIGLAHAQREVAENRPARAGAPASNAPPDAATLQKQAADLSNQMDGLTKAKEALKDRLDLISQQASQAQWLLSLVLGTIGLFTVAQGLFAFFSARNYVKQAEDAIGRADDAVSTAKEAAQRVDELAARVQSRFPMFADTESARAEAFGELSKLAPALDPDQNLYAKSDPLTRQKVFAIESFSAIQFLTPADRSKELITNLRLLGKFYAGKFLSDGQHLQQDFERSYYYLDLAAQKSHRSYSVLNDLGWLFSVGARPADFDKGRALFGESLRSRPGQQRALYNLGTIALKGGNRAGLEQAREYLLKAKRQPNWEAAPNPAMTSRVDYNLACVCAAMARIETNPELKSSLLDECCDHLDQAAAPGAQPKELLDEDLRAGDLVALAKSQPHALFHVYDRSASSRLMRYSGLNTEPSFSLRLTDA
jgi:TPR repeat protein